MTRAPAWARLFVGGLSALLTLWALFGAVASIALVPTPLWTVLGFEITVIAAGVLGTLFGLGRFQSGSALAVLCVAGTVFVASFLADRGSNGAIGSISLALWTPARLAISLILGGTAALLVLTRNPRSWGLIARSAALGAVPALLAALIGLSTLGYGRPIPTTPADATSIPAPPPTKSPAWLDSAVRQANSFWLFQPAKGGSEALRVVGLTVLGILVIGLASASVHYAIHAFELGRPEHAQAPPAPSGAAA